MATGGDLLSSSIKRDSDYVYDYICRLCEKEAKIREAVGWCKNCQDYLCKDCLRHHLRPRPLRHHVLLDKKSMPKRQSCDLCQLDKLEKEAAGYCKMCDDFLCAECYKHHIKPKPMRDHELLNKSRMSHVKQIRDDKQATQHNRSPNPLIPNPLAQKHQATAPPPGHNYRATRAAKRQQKQQHILKQQQQQDETRSHKVHSCSITIAGQHEKTPYITGSVVMPANRLVLADCTNCRIIILALAGSTTQKQLELTSRPHDITMANSTQLAVTCPDDHKLIFVKVGDGLQMDREVKVNGKCSGIACMNDRLVVSYSDPATVELLSMSGQVLQTVITEDQGKDLFSRPWYVEVSRDHASIYISDTGEHTVTRLSLAGQVLATYQDTNLLGALCGLAVDKAGDVYVCGYSTNNVVQMTADLTQPRQLLQESDGVTYPQTVCYCQATEKLVIGMWFSNVIKLFDLKELGHIQHSVCTK